MAAPVCIVDAYIYNITIHTSTPQFANKHTFKNIRTYNIIECMHAVRCRAHHMYVHHTYIRTYARPNTRLSHYRFVVVKFERKNEQILLPLPVVTN